MRAIYKPQGKAGEYAPLACNLYDGCVHGCRYCYVPRVLRKKREEFHAACKVRPGILEALERDAKKYKGQGPVLLCFTSDPYQVGQDTSATRRAIEILNAHDIGVHVLTKGIGVERDFDLLKQHPGNAVAVTLTCYTNYETKHWEPMASPPEYRIDLLRRAHSKDIKTWVSFEPVLKPDDVFKFIPETRAFVDHYKVGKLNNHPLAKEIDWPMFRLQVTALLEHYRKSYYIKEDLRNA